MAIFSRTPRAPLEYSRTLWMRLWVGAVMVFLYAPLVVLMIFSFNDSKRNVVWRGFTLKYYDKALGNDVLVEALVNSLTIAALATLISLILGAGEWAVFRDVLIPHMRPALIAGALLSFTLSLDDFVITYFTSGPDTITFPVKVYSMVRFSVTPEVNAASTLLILLTILLTAVALKLQGVKAIAETH